MNEINISEKLNLQTCCICLEQQTEFDIENSNRLIEYNHCGSYYVHNKCLNTWKLNECLICRKNFNESDNGNDNESDNGNDIITILVNQNERCLKIKQFCVSFCITTYLVCIGLYFLLRKY
uniref:RING-type domain-containing protein n=1 Tax=viral metagenome TaxID=1070528 RepID=A0A6C0LFB5_9ZZZZ